MLVKNANDCAPRPRVMIDQRWSRKTVIIYDRTFFPPLMLEFVKNKTKTKTKHLTKIPKTSTKGEIAHIETAC